MSKFQLDIYLQMVWLFFPKYHQFIEIDFIYLQFAEGTEILYDEHVRVTEHTEHEHTQQQLDGPKKPEEFSESDNDEDIDRNGPLRRKGGFRVSPGTSRKSSWLGW